MKSRNPIPHIQIPSFLLGFLLAYLWQIVQPLMANHTISTHSTASIIGEYLFAITARFVTSNIQSLIPSVLFLGAKLQRRAWYVMVRYPCSILGFLDILNARGQV